MCTGSLCYIVSTRLLGEAPLLRLFWHVNETHRHRDVPQNMFWQDRFARAHSAQSNRIGMQPPTSFVAIFRLFETSHQRQHPLSRNPFLMSIDARREDGNGIMASSRLARILIKLASSWRTLPPRQKTRIHAAGGSIGSCFLGIELIWLGWLGGDNRCCGILSILTARS